MAIKAKNSGCGLMAICLLIIVAIAKCGGNEKPSTVSPTATSRDAAISEPMDAATMYVATANLNCRVEPQKEARAVEKLTYGDAVEVADTHRTWARLKRPAKDCWVAQRFLSDSVPEPEPEPTPVVTMLVPPAFTRPLPIACLWCRRAGAAEAVVADQSAHADR